MHSEDADLPGSSIHEIATHQVEVGVQTDETLVFITAREKLHRNAMKSLQEQAARQAKCILALKSTITSLRTDLENQKNPLSHFKGIYTRTKIYFVLFLSRNP